MHSRGLLPHTSCGTPNAYNASLALYRAFFSISRLGNPLCPPNSTIRVQGRDPFLRTSFASQSTSTAALGKRSTGEGDEDESSSTRQKRKPTHGSYDSYESLPGRQAHLNHAASDRTASMPDSTRRARSSIEDARKPTETIQDDTRVQGREFYRDHRYDSGMVARDRAQNRHFEEHAQVAKETPVMPEVPQKRGKLRKLNQGQEDKQPKYSWQRMMHRIAKDAGDLAKVPVNFSDKQSTAARINQLSYSGQYIEPSDSPLERSMPVPWQWNAAQTSGLSPTKVLDMEIDQFAQYMSLTSIEQAARAAVIQETLTFIHNTLKTTVRCELFGSDKTGLSVATSDIDLSIARIHEDGSEDRRDVSEKMKKLTSDMVDSKDYICVIFRYSKFPIISAQHRRTGLDIQIVSSPSTHAQQDVVRKYLTDTPNLQPLYLLLRTAFGVRGLVDVFNGGIGSYGLFVMLLASLKRRGTNPPTALSDQLLRFLDFYSGLDMNKHGVSVAPPKLFNKHDSRSVPVKEYIESAYRRGDPIRAAQWSIGQQRLYQPYLLCLQDPANPLNDLGRKTNAIRHIQQTIRTLRYKLRHELHSTDGMNVASREKASSLLLPLVGRAHEVYYARRRKVEEYGLEIRTSKRQETGVSRDCQRSFQEAASNEE